MFSRKSLSQVREVSRLHYKWPDLAYSPLNRSDWVGFQDATLAFPRLEGVGILFVRRSTRDLAVDEELRCMLWRLSQAGKLRINSFVKRLADRGTVRKEKAIETTTQSEVEDAREPALGRNS